MTHTIINKFSNNVEVQSKMCSFIIEKAQSTIQLTGSFLIGVSGGSLMKAFCGGLAGRTDIDFARWTVLTCDERHVAHSDSDSTYGYYKENFVDTTASFRRDAFLSTDIDTTVSKAAEIYQTKLITIAKDFKKYNNGFPVFDLLLLGMGPDGHTCSLFPGHPLFMENPEGSILFIKDSPKPPSERVTFSMNLVNNALAVVFMCCGQGKAEMIKRIVIDKDDSLPCTKVTLRGEGTVYWFLDADAASLL